MRADFPILQTTVHGRPLIYLDSAATSQKPQAVIDALDGYYGQYAANVHRGIYEIGEKATARYEEARAKVARFINAPDAHEVVFTRNATEAINLVAYSWGRRNIGRGDAIVLTEMEHHANLVPWQLLAQEKDGDLEFIPITDDGVLRQDVFDVLLRLKPKLVAFTHVSNTLGVINPAAELCAAARKVGALTVVDAAQSAGHMPVDVQAMGCDFLALSGHKMCGPTGVGILYGRAALLDEMPPYRGGGSMISSVDYFESKWAPSPAKFEAGTPNIADAIGLGVAMDYLDGLGREAIAQHDEKLAATAFARIKAEVPGIRILGPAHHRSGVLSFVVPGAHAHDVVTLADREGIALRGGHHCNQPLMRKLGVTSTSRASFYLYNTEDEITALILALQKIQKFFAG
ncbi:MAG TPA: cysteine desulfurase [Opitutaceae bacterium]|nr:cysteine desulfurase [Opitutaceae bacterium]